MTIESATYISSLNASYPAASDPKSEGDDHIRLLKSTVKATFPNVTGAVTPTHTELNFVDGVTSAIQTQIDAKAPVASPAFTGVATITTNSASAALTINQTGAGNAFVVEDSTSPDATPVVIDASGTVVVGHTASLAAGGVTSSLQVQGTTGAAGINVSRWSNNASSVPIVLCKSRGATPNTFGALQSGDDIAGINFFGDDGAAFIPAAQILAEVDGTPGTNDMPGRLTFSTTADGASTLTERIRIASDGLVSLQNSGGLSIARTAVTAPAATDGNVFSGTYTPTLTNSTNVASSTASICQYMRVGSVVTVSGTFSVTSTASGTSSLIGISLPVTSALSSAIQLGGTATHTSATVANDTFGMIIADSTADTALMRFNPKTTGSTAFYFTFTYLVI